MKAISGVYLPTQYRIPGFKKTLLLPLQGTKVIIFNTVTYVRQKY